MANKTNFSDIKEVEPTISILPPHCCGRCAHGRELRDAAQAGRLMIMCKARAPTPVVMMNRGQMMVLAQYPALDPASEGCDLDFKARIEQDAKLI